MIERFDLCVIGAGAGGLSVAAGAAQMGARTVLVEAGLMGGDCLNYGCVPSKALIAAAHAAETFRSSAKFGIGAVEPAIDFAGVQKHVRGVIQAIAPLDSQARFEGLGVTVVRAHGRFVDERTVEAGGRTFRAKHFVLATGSRPVLPPIPGLAATPHLTNETIFDLEDRPSHLIVIGAGPIGCELAQAYRRLGSRVTLVEREALLAREDPELSDVVRSQLIAEGVALLEHTEITSVEPMGGGARLLLAKGGAVLDGDRLLVAAGRRPAISDVGLDAAGVEHSPGGVIVDERMRTSNRRIFAIGDCRKGPQFTHLAGYEAGLVIQNALLRLPAKANHRALPQVTYTDPEIAQVGLTETEAKARYGEARTLRWSFRENDRAQAERRTDGLVKVFVARNKVVGAAIVGPRAGELIHHWGVAIATGQSLRSLAAVMVAYPNYSEVNKRAASSAYSEALFSPALRRLVKILNALP